MRVTNQGYKEHPHFVVWVFFTFRYNQRDGAGPCAPQPLAGGERAWAGGAAAFLAPRRRFLGRRGAMFAGIVEDLCKVVAARPGAHAKAAEARLAVELGELMADLRPGASVAINGVCLTLAERDGSVGTFDVVPETWRLTNLQYLRAGDLVNVERSLRVGDRLDGHFVQGHVDGVGKIDRIQRERGEYKIWIRVATALRPYIARKGSVAVDGVSLTVVDVEQDRFSVVLIPTTLTRTVLGRRQPGAAVNIETDILARLIVSRLEQLRGEGAAVRGALTWEHLQESGFLP
jgi:riboflavin synthase